MKIVFQDGRVVGGALSEKFDADVHHLSSTTFDWDNWWIISRTVRGHLIIAEGYNPNSKPPFNGRPSVYLDQNHWRTLTDAIHRPTRISNAEELRAARELIFLARDGGVVLPLSMGHMIETSGLHGDPRYEVGVTMASLSGGWQIRNPLDLWKWEAQEAIHKHLDRQVPTPPPPISTEPGAMYESASNLGISADSNDNEIFMAMLTMPNVTLSSLVEPDLLPKAQLIDWVNRHTSTTRQMHELDVTKDERRRTARRRYWNENIAFYVRPYRALTRSLDSPSFSDKELEQFLSPSPMVGLLSELFVRRFIDKNVRWRRNDLIDMFHLSGAAAYADFVCAEKHTGTQLRSAQNDLGRAANVYTSISEMVQAIRKTGARSISERANTPASQQTEQ